MFKRRLKLLGKLLLGCIALVVAFLLIERWRGQIALASYKKQLLAKGEKLSVQDFVRIIPEEGNGAPAAWAAIERLKPGLVLPHNCPPRMKVLPSGRAIVGFRESEWIETTNFRDGKYFVETVTNRWQQLAADLEPNGPVLAEFQAALKRPRLNNRIDYAAGAKIQFPHLAPAKGITFWLGGASQLALHEGNPQAALEWLLLQGDVPRLLAEDRMIISELVRIALTAMGRGDTWEALQFDGWQDEDLFAIQQAWERLGFVAEMAVSFEAEKIVLSKWYTAMRDSNEEAYNGLFRWREAPFDSYDPETKRWVAPQLTLQQKLKRLWKRNVLSPLWRFAWSHQAELHGLRAIQALTETGRQAATNKSNLFVEESIKQWISDFCGGSFYDQIRQLDAHIKAMPKSVTKAMHGETDRALTVTAIALKRYFLRYKKYPAALASLTPEFLRTIPTDYMDGQPIKYRLNENGSFTLYSVGEDGKDDGGDMTLSEGSKSRDLWKRRDYVWPAPATAEEVEEYRRKAIEN